MPKYKYTAIDINGNDIKETIFAGNMAEFNSVLKEKNQFCVTVQEISEDDKIISRSNSSVIKMKDVSIFCKQFSTMLSSGITIVKSLDVLYRQAEKERIKAILLRVYEQVQVGKSLSDAMKNVDGAFPAFMISMVEAGEMSGSLDKVMSRLAAHYEKELKLKNKVSSAMVYPIILSVVGLSVVFILFTFVMPNLMSMFGDAQNLPLITKVLFALSNLIRTNWVIIIVIFVGLIMGISFLRHLKGVRRFIDKVKLFTPGFGKLYIKVLASSFCRTMSSVFSSGMSLITSLELTANVLNNSYVNERMLDVIDEIRSGGALSSALSKTDIFPQMMITMLSVGEESGALDDILEKTSDFYDIEADDAIQKMVTMLEPIMIVILGIVIGVVVIGIMAPIYGMYQNIG